MAARKTAPEVVEPPAPEVAEATASEVTEPAPEGRKLAGYVHVDGVVYGPDSDVPAEVAEKITNPDAWATAPAEDEQAE